MSFPVSGESSEDDEGNSLGYGMTNDAIVASSAGGISKSGMGRAAALGMDVGFAEGNHVDRLQRESGGSQVRPSLILKKNFTRLMKKTKQVKDRWSSKHVVDRQSAARPKNENFPSDELKSNASDHSLWPQSCDDVFSVDALASQRSHGVSLVNKLGMAPGVSPY